MRSRRWRSLHEESDRRNPGFADQSAAISKAEKRSPVSGLAGASCHDSVRREDRHPRRGAGSDPDRQLPARPRPAWADSHPRMAGAQDPLPQHPVIRWPVRGSRATTRPSGPRRSWSLAGLSAVGRSAGADGEHDCGVARGPVLDLDERSGLLCLGHQRARVRRDGGCPRGAAIRLTPS
jgi:hypothetical protein